MFVSETVLDCASKDSSTGAATLASILNAKGREVFSVRPDATVYEAIERMAGRGVGALVVMSAAGVLAGIVSERDYARKVVLKDKSSKQTLVSEIMSAPVITAAPCATVADAMRLMVARRIRHLPVVDKGAVTGLVSIGDLVNCVLSAQAETIEHLNNYIRSA